MDEDDAIIPLQELVARLQRAMDTDLFRAEVTFNATLPERMKLGAEPCSGIHDTLICDVCAEAARSDEHQPGEPCPCASIRGEPDSIGVPGGCPGTLGWNHDPAEWGGQHDFDDGTCWRCGGIEPGVTLQEPRVDVSLSLSETQEFIEAVELLSRLVGGQG